MKGWIYVHPPNVKKQYQLTLGCSENQGPRNTTPPPAKIYQGIIMEYKKLLTVTK